MEKIRAFVAIELPAGLAQLLKEVQEEIDWRRKGISWVRPENVHLTLKFLGYAEAGRMDEVIEALCRAKDGVTPFDVTVRGIGAFPDLKHPNVLWVGIEESKELKGLHGAIDEALGGLGFERETRPFHPHLTICRIKSRSEGSGLADKVKRLKGGIDYTFRVSSFALFKSELRPQGALYTRLRQIDL